MKNILPIFLLIIILGCKHEPKVVDKELSVLIDDFIEYDSHKAMWEIEETASNQKRKLLLYSSYHINFEVNGKDTIMSIIQSPFLNSFLFSEPIYSSDSIELSFSQIIPDGYIYYKDKYPLIFFNTKNYFDGKILENNLIREIPDSLKFSGENWHVKIKRRNYKIQNKKFILLDE